MPSINRQNFMTIGEVEGAVLSQITNNTADYNTLASALQAATSAVAAAYPSQPIHYSYWAFQNTSGVWIGQLDVYRGESNPMQHWDVALNFTMEDLDGEYTAVVSTLQTISYTQSTSAIGTFTPPVQS